MTVPTRFIEKSEFEELMRQEGNVLPLYKLFALPFWPPVADPPMHPQEVIGINVLLLNVREPCLYRDRENNMGFVILNGYDSEALNYANFQDCHVIKGAWCYRLAPAYWEEGDTDYDLTEAFYRFNHGEIPKWELGN